MQLAKFLDAHGQARVGLIEGSVIRPLGRDGARPTLSSLLHAADGGAGAAALVDPAAEPLALADARLLAPIDAHEVWGAGVTYHRSKVARQEESEAAASFYDKVYTADRPELFFKANPARVVGPGVAIRARRDSTWTVPEPELALVLAPDLRLVGFTVGNDVSARDIEGRNPLYLPQAKVYDACCGLGPVVTLAAAMPAPEAIEIRLRIERGGATAVEATTSVGQMARSFAELIDWLGRDNAFPDGVVLLTGTGIVPPDDFTLQTGDTVRIAITGIGELVNPVVQGG